MKKKFIWQTIFWVCVMTVGQVIGIIFAVVDYIKKTGDSNVIMNLETTEQVMDFLQRISNPMMVGGAVIVFVVVFIRILFIQNENKTTLQIAADYLYIHKLKKGIDYMYYFCLGIGINVILTFILTSLYSLISSNDTSSASYLSQNTSIILSVAFLVPLAEEIVYRNRIYRALKNISYKNANLIQAILFGLAHGNLVQGLYTFGFGLLFAKEDDYCKSLMPSICMHCGINFFAAMETVFPGSSLFLAPLALISIPKIIEICTRKYEDNT